MCANPLLDVAMDACCQQSTTNTMATHLCKFDVERTTYNTARSRCQNERGGDTCDFYGIDNYSGCTNFWYEESWHWTNQDCLLQVKGEKSTVLTSHIVHSSMIYKQFSHGSFLYNFPHQ